MFTTASKRDPSAVYTDDIKGGVSTYEGKERFECSNQGWLNTPAKASPNMSSTYRIEDLRALCDAAEAAGHETVRFTVWARRRAPATSAPSAEQASE